MEKVHVCTIGGGTGQGNIIAALSSLQGVRFTAITPCSDQGGSSERLREELGVTNAGDLTQCLVRMHPDPKVGEALLARWPQATPLAGHSGKNLLFALWERQLGFEQALDLMHRLVNANGNRVLPASREFARLKAQLANGRWVEGENIIDKLAENPLYDPAQHKIMSVELDPKTPPLYTPTAEALTGSRHILLCPGDPFTSVIPTLLVASSAITTDHDIYMICNITTKPGETQGYTSGDFVALYERILGRSIDHVICNNSRVPPEVAEAYSREHKHVLDIQDMHTEERGRIIPADLWGIDGQGRLRHDPDKTAAAFSRMFNVPVTPAGS